MKPCHSGLILLGRCKQTVRGGAPLGRARALARGYRPSAALLSARPGGPSPRPPVADFRRSLAVALRAGAHPAHGAGWGGVGAGRPIPSVRPGILHSCNAHESAQLQPGPKHQLTRCRTPCRRRGRRSRSAGGRVAAASSSGREQTDSPWNPGFHFAAPLLHPHPSSCPPRCSAHLRKAAPPVTDGKAGKAGDGLGGGEARVGAAGQRLGGGVGGCVHVDGQHRGRVAARSGWGPGEGAGLRRGAAQGSHGACKGTAVPRRALPMGAVRPAPSGAQQRRHPCSRAGLAGDLGGGGLEVGGDGDWGLATRGGGGQHHGPSGGGRGSIEPIFDHASPHAGGGAPNGQQRQ